MIYAEHGYFRDISDFPINAGMTWGDFQKLLIPDMKKKMISIHNYRIYLCSNDSRELNPVISVALGTLCRGRSFSLQEFRINNNQHLLSLWFDFNGPFHLWNIVVVVNSRLINYLSSPDYVWKTVETQIFFNGMRTLMLLVELSTRDLLRRRTKGILKIWTCT
jgi:hypothetical protein